MSSKLDGHQLSGLTGARQTRMSWARIIESFDAIPKIYQESCRGLLENAWPFPYIVFAPVVPAAITVGTRYRTSDKLLCEIDRVLYMWEHVGGQIVVTDYPLEAISFLEVGKILLYSWFTVSGSTSAGKASSTTIEFNTATLRHIAPFLDNMRPASNHMGDASYQAEKDKFDGLESVDFKFMNYARDSLVHGEQVIYAVWQPKIRKQLISLFGFPIYRTISLAHLTILTDKEVIFIGDDKRSVENRGVRYGGIWQYIPLQHITSVSLAKRGEDLLTLSLTLSTGEQRLEKVFTASNHQEMERFRNDLEALLE